MKNISVKTISTCNGMCDDRLASAWVFFDFMGGLLIPTWVGVGERGLMKAGWMLRDLFQGASLEHRTG